MKQLVLSVRALEDLTRILDYIGRDRPQAAVRFVESIEQRCELLAGFPDLGMKREDLGRDVRLFAFRGYGIYYRNLDDRVRIERVLHGAIDVSSSQFDEG
jgi:toxin ParE1/3/4